MTHSSTNTSVLRGRVDLASSGLVTPTKDAKRLGEQKRLVINTNHPFFTKIYDAATEVRAALEVLLLVLAEAELDAEGERETFYKAERQRWSERLRHALDKLVTDDSLTDKRSAIAEELHMTVGPSPQ